MLHRRRPRNLIRRAAFTILEILIAIVVLVLGITGIVALFPTAIESGNRTVEDTYAATLTQSVVDAIAVGLRESRYSFHDSTTNRTWTYFVLNHDGVLDREVLKPEDYSDALGEIWSKDYCILLPQSHAGAENKREDDEPFYVYPVPHVEGGEPWAQRDQRSPTNLSAISEDMPADNLDPDVNTFGRNAASGERQTWFTRVYPLGRYRESDLAPDDPNANPKKGDIRPEYRGAALAGGGTGDDRIALDPYPTYSFAFAIRRHRVDTAGGPPDAFGPTPDGRITSPDQVTDDALADPYSNSLFELRIYIFKNFDPDAAQSLTSTTVPRTNIPIQTFSTLISI